MATEYNFYPFTYPHTKWVYKNRCVTKVDHKIPPSLPEFMKRFMPESHLNGYTVLPKSAVPKDWWGNYDAPGLTQLAIHGNLTYTDIKDVPNQEEIENLYRKEMGALHEEFKDLMSNQNPERMTQYMAKIKEVKDKRIERLSESPEGYVVFGFDCNHHGDAENESLHDPNHVMMLTEQMESQLLLFAEKYEEYKNADQVPATKDIVRTTIMREIRRQAELKTEIGLAGMIEILKGNIPEDDLPG